MFGIDLAGIALLILFRFQIYSLSGCLGRFVWEPSLHKAPSLLLWEIERLTYWNVIYCAVYIVKPAKEQIHCAN